MRAPLYWPITIAAAALVALLTYGVTSQGPNTSLDERLRRGERVPAPTTSLARLDGTDDGSLAEFRGQVVVLNIWASWCRPCRSEMPMLQRLQERIAPQGGTVLGIDTQDAREDARAFLRERQIVFPNLRDPDRSFAHELGVSGYPETFLIDRNGRIAAHRRGPVTSRWLDRHVAVLLDERAASASR